MNDELKIKLKELAAKVKAMSESEAKACGLGVTMVSGHVPSIRNACLAKVQHPSATVLGGCNQWAQQGRIIRKGETAIRIFAAATRQDDGGNEKRFFPSVCVFDISQTEEVGESKRDEWKARAVKRIESRAKPEEKDEKECKKPPAPKSSGCAIPARLIETAKNRLAKAQADMLRSRLTNTHRRRRIAEGVLRDLERTANAARLVIALADAPDLLPDVAINSFVDALALARRDDLPETLRSVVAGKSPSRALIEAKQNSAGCGLDFFPTSKKLANRMAELAEISSMSEVLEPSCGHGSLIMACETLGASVHGLEISRNVAEVARLQCPSAFIENIDFLEWRGGAHYDAVVMNPPFSADQEHIRRAWAHLADGGRLVAICGHAALNSKDKQGEFSGWLNEISASINPLSGAENFDGTSAGAYLIYAKK